MAIDISKSSVETFEPYVGTVFHAQSETGAPVSLTLFRVVPGPPHPQVRQFSLFFNGPLEPCLPQQIVHLSQETLGEMDLFLVPVGIDNSKVIYQAVFNLLITDRPEGGT